jgi:hypothetical protein
VSLRYARITKKRKKNRFFPLVSASLHISQTEKKGPDVSAGKKEMKGTCKFFHPSKNAFFRDQRE